MIRLEKAAYLGINRRSFSLDGIALTETEYTKKVSESWHYHVKNHISYILQGGNREQIKNHEAAPFIEMVEYGKGSPFLEVTSPIILSCCAEQVSKKNGDHTSIRHLHTLK